MNDGTSHTAVIIPAAGSGVRFGGEERKQFRNLGGRSVLSHTLSRFDEHPEVDLIVVAAPAEWRDQLVLRLREEGINKDIVVTEGGDSRQDSVGKGLTACPAIYDTILVHDGVRPFVSAQLITEVLRVARTSGAAAPGMPIADTLRKTMDGLFGETIPRDGLFAMQTPQGFRRAILEDAHDRARKSGYQGTDEVELVQRAGYDIRVVPGDSKNIKITTSSDWEMVCALFEMQKGEARE